MKGEQCVLMKESRWTATSHIQMFFSQMRWPSSHKKLEHEFFIVGHTEIQTLQLSVTAKPGKYGLINYDLKNPGLAFVNVPSIAKVDLFKKDKSMNCLYTLSAFNLNSFLLFNIFNVSKCVSSAKVLQ